MKSLTTLAAMVLVTILNGNVGAAEEERTFVLPKQYAANYVVAPDTVSPDQKFAVIVPKGDPEAISPVGKDYLVALRPFGLIRALETEWPYFIGQSHGGISAQWSEASSVALVTLASKWGPGEVFLLELRDAKLIRATDLLRKMYDLLLPDFRKAKPKPESYNDEIAFIFVGEDPVCTLEGTKLVKIDADAASDPKGGDPHRWKAHITATWDIAQGKFIDQEITHLKRR